MLNGHNKLFSALLFLPHLLKPGPDDGDPVLDGGDRVWVTDSKDTLSHAGGLVDIRSLVLHGAHEVSMRVQQRLQSLRLFRKDTAETECLFRFGEPLQEHLHGCAKLLCLNSETD